MTRSSEKTRGTARSLHAALRPRALCLALLPILALSVVGPGTMVAAATDGGLSVVLCTGEGPVEVVLGPDGTYQPAGQGDNQTGGKHGDRMPCDWSVHAQPALSAPGQALVLAAQLATPFKPAPPVATLRAGRRDLSSSARGPPRA